MTRSKRQLGAVAQPIKVASYHSEHLSRDSLSISISESTEAEAERPLDTAAAPKISPHLDFPYYTRTLNSGKVTPCLAGITTLIPDLLGAHLSRDFATYTIGLDAAAIVFLIAQTDRISSYCLMVNVIGPSTATITSITTASS
jgi:hypothetical protein